MMSNKIRFASLAILLLVGAGSTSAAITVHRFNLGGADDALNDEYLEGKYEYHCISGTSVVGTYGQFGYFQGTVDANNMATVNWFETTSVDGGLEPSSGAATFTYSDVTASGVPLRTAVGSYWHTGSSDMLDSWGEWNSTKGELIQNHTDEDLMHKCLIFNSAFPHTKAARDALPVLHKSFFTSEQGKNQFCVAPLSHVTANYTYVYNKEDMEEATYPNASNIEEGSYDTPVMFQSSMSQGIVAVWKAKTGPFAGDTGTSLYMIANNGTTNQLVGYYCTVNESFERTECFVESYNLDAAASKTTCLPPPEPKACVTSGAGMTGTTAFVALVVAIVSALFM